MTSKVILLIIVLAVSSRALCQDHKPTYQSDKNLNFTSYLDGVKYAYLAMSDSEAKNISDYPKGAKALAIAGTLDFLKEMGFIDVSWGTFTNVPQNFRSLCDLSIVVPSWDFENFECTNIKLSFLSCNKDIFQFISEKNIRIARNTDIKDAFHDRFLKMCEYSIKYSPRNRMKLPSEMTTWNEHKLISQFQENGADQIEGIYESTVRTPAMAKYKLGVVKSDHGYTLVYLAGAANYEDWKEGEVKANVSATATPNLFKAIWIMGNKMENDNAYITFQTGLMELLMQGRDKDVFIKLFPTFNDNVPVKSAVPSSGTGFGITSNGLIVTNSHVVNGASKISVRGLNGDFSKSYSAKLLTEDKHNDLAIIQINDTTFSSLGVIPFTIASASSDVGSSVFVLGYPLKAVMGDEIKLTNGIISSKSGFQGDVTSYQISVPLQPGNSGGPLFDENGNLVGIVNAKLSIGENVSYAIKVGFLTDLLDLLPATPKLQTINSLAGKPLTEQVKRLNRYVYIIEVN